MKEGAVARFESRTARGVGVGLGYVGLPFGTAVRRRRLSCYGFDIDSTKIDMLASWRSYICRIPATEIAPARDRGFHAAIDFTFVSEMDAIIIGVPTPLTEYHEPDLNYVNRDRENRSLRT